MMHMQCGCVYVYDTHTDVRVHTHTRTHKHGLGVCVCVCECVYACVIYILIISILIISFLLFESVTTPLRQIQSAGTCKASHHTCRVLRVSYKKYHNTPPPDQVRCTYPLLTIVLVPYLD